MENNQNLLELIERLEERIKNLEEENIETSNCLYELSNQIDAVDARIDILAVEKWIGKNV
jgi:septal ring factor EnvC (AmiA/AmiB activator)